MPQTTRDFIYENAPLIEVIAEVRWSLISLTALQGAAVDPFFNIISDQFTSSSASLGLPQFERIIPPDVPIELLGGQPIFRFRPAPNKWPLIQVGPGILTCNSVPPYDGWANFEAFISRSLGVLMKTQPFSSGFSKVTALSLRYIDGFTVDHGLNDQATFLRDHLGMEFQPRGDFIEKFASAGSSPSVGVEFSLNSKSPEGAAVTVKFSPGMKDDNPAVIGEISSSVAYRDGIKLESLDIPKWMSQSHATLHDVFEHITSQELKTLMKRRPLGGESR